jgi:hypothetical protein
MQRTFRVLDHEDDDPMLSIINLVDVFLVAIGFLLIGMITRSALSFGSPSDDGLTVIRKSGASGMEILVMEKEAISKLRSSGVSVDGDGERIGIAYRLQDGTIVYVPSSAPAPTQNGS